VTWSAESLRLTLVLRACLEIMGGFEYNCQ
jgi:hypothetical protein